MNNDFWSRVRWFANDFHEWLLTVNNDFWSRVRWFANDFHEWRSHEWKSLANHLTRDQKSLLMKIIGKSPHSWPKIVIHGNECIILFLTRYFVLNTPFRYKQTSFAHFAIAPRTVFFSDLTLWRHHCWSVTSRECEVLALWRHISQLFLHAQIGAKEIFTSE